MRRKGHEFGQCRRVKFGRFSIVDKRRTARDPHLSALIQDPPNSVGPTSGCGHESRAAHIWRWTLAAPTNLGAKRRTLMTISRASLRRTPNT